MSSPQLPTTEHHGIGEKNESLLERVAFLGARPFHQQVVQSPWSTVIDAPSLHREVKERIHCLINTCEKAEATRCLTLVGNSGYGKTHLLAWMRNLLDERGDAVFVYVSPYGAAGQANLSPEQHVMGATLDALWLRSRRQQTCFEQAVRSFLVSCYDRIVDSGQGIKEVLRAGSFWSRLFRRSRLRIERFGPQDQLAALQRAFGRRRFFERAFKEFNQQHPIGADGVLPDWDTFVAACLLTCGDTRQRWHADRWFRAYPIPPDVFEPFHLDQPCQGTEKIRNGLFTLQRLMGRSFCLAFDQIEDTYLTLSKPGAFEAVRFSQLLGILLRNLTVMPGVCLLFACQQSVWQDFAHSAPPMLIDRMVEGYGAQVLRPLDEANSQELIRERMRASVWSQLVDGGPPADEPYFPFTIEEIRQMRIDTGGELRNFLQRAQQEFERRLASPPKPPQHLMMRLTTLEPREVMSHEPTAVLIQGENFPAEVRVLFAGQPAPMQPVCRPGVGQIDVTTPTGLVDDVEVRVEAMDDPNNAACLILRFVEREVPRPYCRHVDRGRLKARREELKLKQKEVAQQVGSLQPHISRLETGKWADAPDELFVRLAERYGVPLSHFLKR
jgi:hypothetical protein